MKTRVLEENLVAPEIEISTYAMDKIRYVVEKNDMEIGWLGFVDTIPDEKNPNHYKITDIVIVDQHRHGTTCELDEEGYDKLVHEIVEKFKDDPDEEADIKLINKLLFWGHSHVNMGTSPSGQDETQAKKFAKKGKIIRGIFNKKGEINLSFFDFEKNLAWDDLTLHMESALTDEDRKKLDEDIETKVKLLEYTSPAASTSPETPAWGAWYGARNGGYYGGYSKNYDLECGGYVYDKVSGGWVKSSKAPENPIVKSYSVAHPKTKDEIEDEQAIYQGELSYE